MRRKNEINRILGVLIFVIGGAASAAELPANFPSDVPIAEYMEVTSVTQVRDDMMVDLHAPGQTIEAVVEWFQAALTAAGWESDGDSISERKAILAYSKNGRRCGVSITNFVLNSSMQMDESIKGITLQVSAAAAPSAGASESASIAGDATEQ